jgi:hypothetical protein
MTRKPHGVWLLSTMLAGAAVQASAANIVVDPGFESGIPGSYTGDMGDGWVVTAGTGAICNVSGAGCGSAGPAHTGSQMGFLDWSDSLNTISQTLTTDIGRTYTISFWVAGDQPNFLNVTFGGSTLFNGTAPTTGDYVQFTFGSTATSTNTVLAFSGQRTAGGVELLDDVSVSASGVPEPATWTLTPVALLGLGVLRRRHWISPRGNLHREATTVRASAASARTPSIPACDLSARTPFSLT